MRVGLDQIGPDGFCFDRVISAEWIGEALGKGSPFHAMDEGRLKVTLMRIEESVHVQGRVDLAVGAQCSRCLEQVDVKLVTPISVTLYPIGKEPAPSSEGDLSEEDMGVGTFSDDEVDLASIVRDEVFLELPMNPVCSETCAGICPECGKNLNENDCSCVRPLDSRWQALSEIKLS